MRVSVNQGRDWLGLEGGLILDDGNLLGMCELLNLVAEAQGRFVRLAEREYLVLSEQLRKRLDALRGLTDQGRFHPLAAGAIDETLDGMEVKTSKHWRGLLARLAEVQDLEPALPSTLQAELRDYQLDAFSEILDELLENRHKALVFSQFVDHLTLIRAHLDARGGRLSYEDMLALLRDQAD
jgi:SNF2 family DNA or RNA helicase